MVHSSDQTRDWLNDLTIKRKIKLKVYKKKPVVQSTEEDPNFPSD